MSFRSDTYNEVLLTLRSGDLVNSAPVGVLYRRGKLYARIYSGSKTYESIKSGVNKCSVCITLDPFLFYYAVLEKDKLRYVFDEYTDYPCIVDCDTCIYGELEVLEEKQYYLWIAIKPERIKFYRRLPRVYHRCDYALIEALIYYTKIPYVEHLREKYIEKIMSCRETIYRSTRSKRYREAIDKILSLIRSYNI